MQVAIIEGHTIINAVEVDELDCVVVSAEQKAEPMEQAIKSYELGDALRPPPPTWDKIREHRNVLLAASDWTQLEDATVDRAAWAQYRQALRDLPKTYKQADAVNFPERPD